MAFVSTKIPYSQTGFFSKIVTDYLNDETKLQPFYKHQVTVEGLKASIEARKAFASPRAKLADALENQYRNIITTDQVKLNIDALRKETTFTITTAHQPNIFTGPLYFLYKILHVIKLAENCKTKFPEYDFVPVYYMGSEDADLDELGHIFINGNKLNWNTTQTGAVGRMLVDKPLWELLNTIAGEVGVLEHGQEIISIVKKHYTLGTTIQEATMKLVNALFGKYGLIVVIPDNPTLKTLAEEIFSEELTNGHSSKIIEETGNNLTAAGYKAQAHSREINFFFMKENLRERIEKNGDIWSVVNTGITFSKNELLQELNSHPERFSPNVITRGLFQELILPNVAFIGGGGELAYWFQLKDLFAYYKVPYPLLILRNSFLLINKLQRAILFKLDFDCNEPFKPLQELQNNWIRQNSHHNLSIDNALQQASELYNGLSQQTKPIDTTLLQHIEALKTNSKKLIEKLGKKMLRAEKRNHDDAMQQIRKIKDQLFPNNNLQERIDNFIPHYAIHGSTLIDELYNHSLTLEQEFVVLEHLF